jgi:hypothetical protein
LLGVLSPNSNSQQIAGQGRRLNEFPKENPMPHPYYKAGVTPHSHETEVWLDGVRLPLCVEASEAGGWARVFQTNPAGEIERDCLGNPRTEIRRGQVRILRNSFEWGAVG